MPTHRSRVIIVAAAAIVSIASGCGGSSDEIVARVAGVEAITKAKLLHWTHIEAVLLYQEDPLVPVPNGVMPDPPKYSACVRFLETAGTKPSENAPKPTKAQLAGRCAGRYRELQGLALNFLLSWYWTLGEGKEHGVTANDAEARVQLNEVSKNYKSPADFNRYVHLTGQTVADMLFRAKIQIVEKRLLKKQEAAVAQVSKGLSAQQREQALAAIANRFQPERRWVAKTSCSANYVTSGCREYRGSGAPALPN